jgi:short-subunit dehydrogenase
VTTLTNNREKADARTVDSAAGLAVVTGAGSGIGRAIAFELVNRNVSCCLVGRTLSKLQEVARSASRAGVECILKAVDLCEPEAVATLGAEVKALGRPVDLLVHSAAAIRRAFVEASTVDEFNYLLAVNLVAPFALTKNLLPLLCANKGQIVFVNSSVVHHPAAGVVQYAATKHALKGLADGLRQEVNARGVRVLSVYPGQTATPLQAALYAAQGREYRPENLLQPEDVARVVIQATTMPYTAEITEIMIRPAAKG